MKLQSGVVCEKALAIQSGVPMETIVQPFSIKSQERFYSGTHTQYKKTVFMKK
jgi:hypothetical protein